MKKFLLILVIAFSTHAYVALASSVALVAPVHSRVSEKVIVHVDIDTSGVVINSFDITVSYPSSMTFSGYKENASIRKLWLVPPNASLGTVHLSGIIPGGVDGLYDPDKSGLQSIPIVDLVFTANKEGIALFSIIHSDILKNDGHGTLLTHTDIGTSINVAQAVEEIYKAPEVKDTQPPLPFEVIYNDSEFFSKTPPLAIFSTTDVDSGVEKYQMNTGSSIWQDVTSPLPVNKGLLRHTLYIRAVDFAGNYQESSIEIPGLVSISELFIVVGVLLLWYIIYRRRKRNK